MKCISTAVAAVLVLVANAASAAEAHKYYKEGYAGVPAGTAFGIGLIGAVKDNVSDPNYPLGYKRGGYVGKQWYQNPYYDSYKAGE